jgi:5-methylcytosine-specific restriction endonuclease McrA
MAAGIISRDDARAQGLKHYFTGESCRNGHVAERLVSNKLCRECRSAVWQAFRERHPERVAANSDKQNKRCVSEGYFRSYYRQNDEKRKAQASDWYSANKERALSACKRWAERNPEKRLEMGRMNARRRRAKLAASGGSHTYADLERIFKQQRGKCAMCKCGLSVENRQVDHIIAISRGGNNTAANLQYLCRPCNRAKHAKDPIQFAQERGLLL